jgi:alpha-methylacyl-CoA racemase
MGPLAGLRVIELAGLGPGPFCAMMLADMGADVLRVDRPEAVDGLAGTPGSMAPDHLVYRGRKSVAIDLKQAEGVELLLGLLDDADAIVEGYRPGVAERLGIGPEPCLERNPRLVYGRMTGWGQEGPWAQHPGHDINYISMTGVGATIGPAEGPPVPALNLIGDNGGGGMLLAFGIVAALLESRTSGTGQVVDAAMVDGASLLAVAFYGWRDSGQWSLRRGSNLLDGGAPFYSYYEAADGGHLAVGALEPQFYANLLRVLGLDPGQLPDQQDRAGWPVLRERFAAAFRTRSRDEWMLEFAEASACVTPVLDMDEAREDPLNRAREVFVEKDSERQPRPSPRFSRTEPALARGPAEAGQHTAEALAEWGVERSKIEALLERGVLRERN